MGEIKSTLDLVMEKTKNLSLSDEERLGQKNKEIASRIRGLLQNPNTKNCRKTMTCRKTHLWSKKYAGRSNLERIMTPCLNCWPGLRLRILKGSLRFYMNSMTLLIRRPGNDLKFYRTSLLKRILSPARRSYPTWKLIKPGESRPGR